MDMLKGDQITSDKSPMADGGTDGSATGETCKCPKCGYEGDATEFEGNADDTANADDGTSANDYSKDTNKIDPNSGTKLPGLIMAIMKGKK